VIRGYTARHAEQRIPLLYVHTDKGAWALTEQGPVSERLARQALLFAARETLASDEWLTHDRWTLIVKRLIHRDVVALDRPGRWEWLVTAVGAGFGPMIAGALDALVTP
jgi:hypothetical protein